MLRASTADLPITEAELANARNALILGLSNAWATNRGVGGAIVDQAANRLPADYYSTYADRVAAASLADVRRSGVELLGRQPLTWVVVGDLATIEPAIRALNLGEVRIIDADGRSASLD